VIRRKWCDREVVGRDRRGGVIDMEGGSGVIERER
jgi:hypothetical protein